MRNTEIKKMTVAAMLTALSVLICVLASFFPTMSLSLTAIAGFVTAAALIHCGYKYSILVYVAASLLIWMLVPDKQCAVYYTVLFGHYPIIKLLAERINNRGLVWLIKAVVYCILFAVVYLVSLFILGIEEHVGTAEAVFTSILFFVVFVLYDICIGRLSLFYISKISKNERFH